MSVLQTPEVSAVYRKQFVGVHSDFTELDLDYNDPRHATIERHNPRELRPVLVFLDASGKEVARQTGKLKSAKDALLLARFVSERHYLKTDWPTFLRANANIAN